MHHLIDRTTHTMAFVTPVVEHWLEQKIVIFKRDINIVNVCLYFTYFTHNKDKISNINDNKL